MEGSDKRSRQSHTLHMGSMTTVFSVFVDKTGGGHYESYFNKTGNGYYDGAHTVGFFRNN